MNTWNLDQAHSTIGFKVKHLMVSTVRGSFTDFSGTLESADDTFENAKASFTAKAASIATGNDGRDAHLRGEDFFDVEKFPEVTFTSKSFTKKGEAFEVVGDFTMKGVTQEIVLTATTEGVGIGMDGKKMVGFEITGSISRESFGLTWNAALETGGVAVSDTVNFDIHVEFVAG